MKLEKMFQRAVPGGGPGDPPILGSDVAPVDDMYLALDNVFFCPQYGPDAEPINAVSLSYDGPVGAPTLTFTLYFWDEYSTKWFEFGTVDINVGTAKFVSLPNMVDRKDTRQVSRIAVALVSNNPLAPAAGTYTFLSSAVTGVPSLDPSAFAGIIAVLNLILADTTSIAGDTATIAADTTSIDGKIENPMPVVGDVAVGAAAAGDPVIVGLRDTAGNVQRLAGDTSGDTFVAGPQAVGAASTANPVVGGMVDYSTNLVRRFQSYLVSSGAYALQVYNTAMTPPEGNYSTGMSDGSAVRASDTTITLTTTYTVTTNQLRKVVVNTGTAINTYEQGKNGIYLTYAVGTITIAGAGAAPVPAGSTVEIRWTGPERGGGPDSSVIISESLRVGAKAMADIFGSAATDAWKVSLVTDLFRRLHVRPAGYDSVGDGLRALLASSLGEPTFTDMSQTTSIAGAAGPAGVDVDFYLDMDDYEHASVQLYSTAGNAVKSLTFAATDQDDGTAPASCVYNSQSTSWFGAAAFAIAAGVQTDTWSIFELDTPTTVRYVRVRMNLIDAGATVNNQWVMYARKRRI